VRKKAAELSISFKHVFALTTSLFNILLLGFVGVFLYNLYLIVNFGFFLIYLLFLFILLQLVLHLVLFFSKLSEVEVTAEGGLLIVFVEFFDLRKFNFVVIYEGEFVLLNLFQTFFKGPVWRGQYGIYSYPKSTIQHSWDDSSKDRTPVNFQARIGVSFNELNCEIFVDHKVKAKNLKRMNTAIRINALVSDRAEGLCHQMSYLWQYIFVELDGTRVLSSCQKLWWL